MPRMSAEKREIDKSILHLAKNFEIMGLGRSLAVERASRIIVRGVKATAEAIAGLSRPRPEA